MKQQSGGFTMIELLLAMSVFSFMLLIVSVAFVNIVRVQQAGVVSRATQQNARRSMEEIISTARQAQGVVVNSPTNICFITSTSTGFVQFYLDPASKQLRTGITYDPTCATAASPYSSLNDTTTLFEYFDVQKTVSGGQGAATRSTIMVTLSAASNFNLTALDPVGSPPTVPPNTRCLPGAGAQFCSVSTLTSTAELRGGN